MGGSTAQLVSSNRSRGGNKNLYILLDFEWFGIVHQHYPHRGMPCNEAGVCHIGIVIFARSVPDVDIFVRKGVGQEWKHVIVATEGIGVQCVDLLA